MDPYQNRRWVVILILLLIGLVFVFRLLFIQVLDPKWKDRARRITHTEKSIQPPRGLIYDRNGKLLVSANQVYDIMITPREIGEIDTLALCSLFSISKEQFDHGRRNNSIVSWFWHHHARCKHQCWYIFRLLW